MDDLAREELLMAQHILLGTLCGVLKILEPGVIEPLREALVEKLASASPQHPAIKAATARALSMVPPEA